MNLEKNNVKSDPDDMLEIETDYFEKIYHLRFYSFDNSEAERMPYRCFVACKKIDMKQVCLFNLSKTNIFNVIKDEEGSSSDEKEANETNMTNLSIMSKEKVLG